MAPCSALMVPAPLRFRQVRPYRLQRLAELTHSWSDRLGRPHPPAGFPLRDAQGGGEQLPGRPVAQLTGQVLLVGGVDQGVVDQRQPVPGLLKGMQIVHQLNPVDLIRRPVVSRFDQTIEDGSECIEGNTKRRRGDRTAFLA